MRRILLIGSPGSGKSTLARALGARFHLPVTHLDRLWWRPGWVELGAEKFRPLVAEIVARDKWVIDGNYSNTWDLRMPRADTIVWMDLPRRVCLWRVFRRAVTAPVTVPPRSRWPAARPAARAVPRAACPGSGTSS